MKWFRQFIKNQNWGIFRMMSFLATSFDFFLYFRKWVDVTFLINSEKLKFLNVTG